MTSRRKWHPGHASNVSALLRRLNASRAGTPFDDWRLSVNRKERTITFRAPNGFYRLTLKRWPADDRGPIAASDVIAHDVRAG